MELWVSRPETSMFIGNFYLYEKNEFFRIMFPFTNYVMKMNYMTK